MTTDHEYIRSQIEGLTDEKLTLLVSEWAEKRYIPPELSSRPGYWDNDYTPYLREIMDCFSMAVPVRKVAFMKSAQIGATTGVIENQIGYKIDHAPGSMLYVSADKELVKMSIDVKVDRMLDSCGLLDKLTPADPRSRKTGNTSSQKDFPGGFLIAVGAQNPGKLRSMSFQTLMLDEVDGMPDKLGEEGDPLALAEKRTAAFESTRKIAYISTPLVMQTSKIFKMYERGDQRRYYVPCIHCGEMQELVWHGTDEGGQIYGLDFEVNDRGVLVEDSVRYVCRHCFEPWEEHSKAWFLKRGEWRATAEAQEVGFRSYHINSLYSPVGMYSWVGMAYAFVKCYDVKTQKIKDLEAYKTFHNTDLGLPWEEKGEAPVFERVVTHRRAVYQSDEVPNAAAIQETGGPMLLLTAAGDVHKDRIDVEIVGWTAGGQSYSIAWRHYEGDTEDLHSAKSPWEKMREMIEREVFVADDGKKYNVVFTMIDARYRTDFVYSFCGEYEAGVYPVMGRDSAVKTGKLREFDEYESKTGIPAYNVNTTLYKDRLAGFLRRDWDAGEIQPIGYPNYPSDYGDDFFRQYGSEYKQVEKSKKTGQILGYYWIKKPNADNHAWDCRVYNMAALDILAYSVCVADYDLEGISYMTFWDHCREGHYYWT